MKTLFLAAAALAGSALVHPIHANAEIIDEIVATVDDEAILRSSIMFEIQPALNELREMAARENFNQDEFNRRAEAELRRSLDQNIEMNLLYRQALLLGAQVDEERIDESIESLRSQFDSNDDFMESLDSAGETIVDIRAREKKRFLAGWMRREKIEEFSAEVVISESDVNDFYRERGSEYRVEESVIVRQIFLSAPGSGEAARARAQLENLREELEAGADFAELAGAHSELFPDNGGSMGRQRLDSFVPELSAIIADLEEGEVSEVIETQFGVQLLMLDERQEAGTLPLEEVRIEIEPILRTEEAEKRYVKWLKDLRRSSRVRVFI